MSDSNEYKTWCSHAKFLLGNIHATTFDYTETLKGADKIISGGQPPEMTNEDWLGIQHYVAAAKAGFQTQSQTKNMKKKLKAGKSVAPTEAQQESVKTLQFVMQTIADDTTTKREALAQLKAKHKIEDHLDATGLAEIAQLDDPETAFKTMGTLKTRIQAAATACGEKDLSKLVPTGLPAKGTDAEQKLKALDLDSAQALVEELEAGVAAARAELKAILELQKTLQTAEMQELKLDGMRKLVKLEQSFKQIKDTYEKVIAGVRVEIGKDEKSKDESVKTKAKSRKSQCDSIEKDFPEIIAQWPNLSAKDKVSDHGRISVGRLVERLDVVGRKPPPPPPPDPAVAALLLQQAAEWTSFRTDVRTKWQLFENSNYSPALRGPFPSNGVLTDHVRNRCETMQTVQISGRVYRYSLSITAGRSMKSALPPPYQLNAAGEPIMSFIYHLPPA